MTKALTLTRKLTLMLQPWQTVPMANYNQSTPVSILASTSTSRSPMKTVKTTNRQTEKKKTAS